MADEKLLSKLRAIVLVVLLFGVLVIMSLMNPAFFQVSNLMSAVSLAAPLGFVALGMTLVLLIGGIDLSVGAMFAAGSLSTAWSSSSGLPPVVSILFGVAVGALLGFINGVLVSSFNLPAIVVTLATLAVFGGCSLALSGGSSVPVGDELAFLGQGQVVGIPVPFLVFLVTGLVMWFCLKKTAFGEYVYGYGTNPEAAKYAPLSVKKLVILVYMLAGILSSFGGCVFSAMVSSAKSNYGFGYEMLAVTIAVVGGTALVGGRGTIWGTILATLFIAFLQNGMSISFVATEVQTMVVGLALLVTAVLYKWAPIVHVQMLSNKTRNRSK